MSAPAPEPADAPECDHEWEHIDASFDHEFGTEQVHYWECRLCGSTTNKCPFPDHD